MRKLYPHQETAIAYCETHRHLALFMEMRLGKTLVMIRRLRALGLGGQASTRQLVVAPGSALESWRMELTEEDEAFFRLDNGPKKTHLDFLRSKSPGWYLINKEGWMRLPEIAKIGWDAVILDESHFIKNPRAQATRFFLQNFRTVPNRAILTGTPTPEGTQDAVCQLLFLWGTCKGCKSFWKFRAKWMTPDWSGYGWVLTGQGVLALREEMARSCLVMRRKDVHLQEVKVREVRTITMPSAIRSKYDSMESSFYAELETETVKTIWSGAQYSFLRQMCGGFLDGTLLWDEKYKALEELLQGELREEPVVVWYNFNAEIELTRDRLELTGIPCGVLWGALPRRHREAVLEQWRAGAFRILLVQQAVAQSGVNLSHSDTAIYFSEPNGGAAAVQTEDRILSMEKIQKGNPLLYLYLVVENSVDTDIRESMCGKKLETDIILSRVRAQSLKRRVIHGRGYTTQNVSSGNPST